MVNLEICGLRHAYGDVVSLHEIDLDVAAGEIVVVLGPSGSGKTTLLQLLAGHLTPERGEIHLGGRLLSSPHQVLAPERRDIGMVFQDFALWPHMTVRETVLFPLEVQRKSSAEKRARLDELLALVHLEGYEERYPHELSGGQRQRVALARALAPKPSLILLDEPMSSLDARLREALRVELKDVLLKEQVTSLYVTHDRMEALVMADRVFLMREGAVVQVGTPEDLYDRPRSAFAATFLGPANLLRAQAMALTGGYGEETIVPVETRFGLRVDAMADGRVGEGTTGLWMVRPEHLGLGDGEQTQASFTARVCQVAYIGSHWQVTLALADGETLVAHAERRPALGETATVTVSSKARWFIADHLA